MGYLALTHSDNPTQFDVLITGLNSRGRLRDISSLTAMRGGLAVWVVAYHFWNRVLQFFPALAVFSPIARRGLMAVPAFFMLSGFVLAFNYANRLRQLEFSQTVRFLLTRLARIYPVHLATLLAVALMVAISHRAGMGLTESGYSAHAFVLNLFLVHTWIPDFSLNWNYPSWSVSSEWFAYLLFPFIVAWGTSRLTTPKNALVCGLIALAASAGVMMFWKPLPFYEIVLVIPTFIAGMSISYALTGRGGHSWCSPWAADCVAISIPAVCLIRSLTVNTPALLCLFFALIAALACLKDGCHRFWKARFTVFLGDVSYSLYMTHTLAQKIGDKLLPSSRLAMSSSLLRLGALALDAAFVAALCLGCYYLVEKPCRDGFRGLLRRSIAVPIEQGSCTAPCQPSV
ncbi:MAG: acyltransferase [Planctomycetota bacterium]|nr:acyltransferase [Planctomycetota bacterium]